MNNLKLNRCFFIAAAIALLAVFMSVPAGAGDLNWKLKGDYAWNSSGTCASASCGFDTNQIPGPNRNLQPCSGPLPVAIGISYNYSIQGEFSFDGQGGFDFSGEVLSIMLEPYPNPATIPPLPTSANFKSPIHHFDADGAGTYIVEFEANELFVEIKFDYLKIKGTPYEFRGAIFRGRLTSGSVGSVVFLGSTSPTPEDVVGYPFPKMQRICNATGSMVKLSPGRKVLSKE
jgi:hypothetical protein